MVNSAYIYSPDSVSPPGHALKRILESMGMTQIEFASRLGKTQKFVSELLNGKAPISPETAIHLERVLGAPASYWNNREAAYREWIARNAEKRELQEHEDWARSFPLKQLVGYRWIESEASSSGKVEQLLDFFGIATPAEWSAVWAGKLPAIAFRRTKTQDIDRHALSAWLRYGEIQAQRIDAPDYDRPSFENALKIARDLTTKHPDEFQPRLTDLCRVAGVALVFTPDLPRTRVFAATRWQSPRRPLIQLGLRYKTDDHLWFSFFHEAIHILRHSKKAFFLECGTVDSDAELEADRVAADLLIPPKVYTELVSNPPYSKIKIRQFATDIGIAPGIVVGRLQHDGHLPHSHCNDLKRRYSWKT